MPKLTLNKKKPSEEIPIKQVVLGQLDKRELRSVPVENLIPYKNNANKGDVDKVAASLKEFGYVKNSVGIDENNVLLYGHTTLKAMQKLGWDKVPEVTQIFELSETKKKAYRLMDNQAGRSAEWDFELLVNELNELKMEKFNIALTGFDEKAYEQIKENLDGLVVNDPKKEWGGMPEYNPTNLTAKHSIIVNFAEYEDIQTFAKLIGQKLTDKTRAIWYPKAEILHSDLVIEDE